MGKNNFFASVRDEFKLLHVPTKKVLAKTTLLVMGVSALGGIVLGAYNAAMSYLMTVIFF